MRITKRRLRKILWESLLLESRKTREWIKTQPETDQANLLDAYNKGLTVIDQLSWIQKTRGTEPIQDVVPDVIRFFEPQVQAIVKENGFQTNLSRRTYPTVNDLRRVISQVDALIDSRKEATTEPAIKPFDDPYHVDRLSQVGPWTILMPRTVTGSVSCDISGDDTSWCTTKKKGQNLFISYVGREGKDVILFYVMDYNRTPDDPYKNRTSACMANNDSRLSIGFVGGQPVLQGESGGLSVDAANMGLTEDVLRSDNGLGQYYDQIMAILMAEAQVIGINHPAKLEMRKAATDVLHLKNIIKDYEEEARVDFLEQILDSKNKMSPEVVEFIFLYRPDFLFDALRAGSHYLESISADFINKIYFLLSTKDIKDVFAREHEHKHFSTHNDPHTFNKGLFYKLMLTQHSYLMRDQVLDTCLEEYLNFVTAPTNRQSDKERAYEELIGEIMQGAQFTKGIHPRFQEDIYAIEKEILSEQNMEDIVDKVENIRYSPDGFIRNLNLAFDNSKNEDLKEEFFLGSIEHRFNHILSAARVLYDTGGSKSLEVSAMDGLALSVTISILDGIEGRNINEIKLSPRIIQEIENAIDENFPEFFQMSPKDFDLFLREGAHDLDRLFNSFRKANTKSLDMYIRPIYDYTTIESLKEHDMKVESWFTKTFVKLSASDHISDRFTNHAKKYFDEGFHHTFVKNKSKCSDQFLLEKMREISKKPKIEKQRLQWDGTMATYTRPPAGLIDIKHEVQTRSSYGQWALGNDAYTEIMRLGPDY
jgi:hypothetical protein